MKQIIIFAIVLIIAAVVSEAFLLLPKKNDDKHYGERGLLGHFLGKILGHVGDGKTKGS